MEEYAITVKDLKIRYKSVQAYSIKKSLLRLKGVEAKAFEAVRGISFEVEQGEILGITGKNGSGKSTLLRALAHIFSAYSLRIKFGTLELYGLKLPYSKNPVNSGRWYRRQQKICFSLEDSAKKALTSS